MGARKYKNDTDTEFIAYPENNFSWNFGTPGYIAARADRNASEQAMNSSPDSAVSCVMSAFTILASVTLL